MLNRSDVESAFSQFLPFEHDERKLVLAYTDWPPPRSPAESIALDDEGHLEVTFQHLRHNKGELRDIAEFCVTYDVANVDAARFATYLRGWKMAFKDVPEDETVLFAAPSSLADPAIVTAEDFANVIRKGDTSFEDGYAGYLATARPESEEEIAQRRVLYFNEAMRRYPAVAEHVKKVWGVYLPKQVALLCAFVWSLTDSERAIFERYNIRLGGVCEFFGDGGLERTLKEGRDERLHEIGWNHTPELMCVMRDGDGDAYSLFYDDPKHAPSGVVWERREGGTVWKTEMALDLLGEWFAQQKDEHERDTRYDAQLLLDAVQIFNELMCGDLGEASEFKSLTEQVRDEDRAMMQWSFEERKQMAGSACGVAIATTLGDAAGLSFAEEGRFYAYDHHEVQKHIPEWIAKAKALLKDGDPRYALALGRDLYASHQGFEEPPWQKEALELMVAAYEALGRDAFARNVEVHHANRNFAHKSVYED